MRTIDRALIQGGMLALVVGIASLLGASSARAQEVAANFQDADLRAVLEVVADVTGKRFILDPRVEANVTLLSPTPRTPDDLLGAVGSVLEGLGFSMIAAGSDLHVVPRGAGQLPADAPPSRIIASSIPVALPPLNSNRVIVSLPLPDWDPAKEISLQPVRTKGAQRGYRVYPIGDGIAFKRLGFDPGDLVSTINGVALTDPVRGEAVFNQAVRAVAVEVQLERGGIVQHLILNRRRSGF